MNVVPMPQVDDIPSTSAWYQRVLGLVSGHGGDKFEMLFAGDPFASPLLLQLHPWDATEHGFHGSPDQPVGNGSSLWFQVDDRAALDARWEAATAYGAASLSTPAWNPIAHHHEFALRDSNGYVIVVHTPFRPHQG